MQRNKIDPNIGFSDYWIIKLDSTSNILWQMVLGGSAEEVPYSILQTPDGGYIVGVWSASDEDGYGFIDIDIYRQ